MTNRFIRDIGRW